MNELDEAERLLTQYVQKFQEFFGENNMSFNVHLLTHITDTVRNWGPTWVTDAYKYESWNKRIVAKVTSPNCRTDQIANRFLMAKFIDSVVFDDYISEETKSLVAHIRSIYKNHGGEAREDFIGLGKTERRSPTDDGKEALLSKMDRVPDSLLCYKLAKIYGNQYRRKRAQITKFCDSMIFCEEYGFGEIINIVQFEREGDNVYGFFINRFNIIRSAFGVDYMKQVAITDAILFLEITRIIKPAVQILSSENLYCYALPNCWRGD